MKDLILDLLHNYWLWSAVGGWGISQVAKLFTGVFKARKWSLRAMIFGSGGMPSAHTAAIIGLLTSLVLTEGGKSPITILAGLLAVVMMTDAAGVRRETGRQSKFLNRAAKEQGIDTPIFQEFMGHSPIQIAVGAAIGVISAVGLYFLPWFAL